MKGWLLVGLALVCLLPGCPRYTIRVEPIEIKPIYITMDINVRIQRELDEDLSFQDEIERQLEEELKKAQGKEGGSP